MTNYSIILEVITPYTSGMEIKLQKDYVLEGNYANIYDPISFILF